jgi:hypothetical protein
MKLLCVLFVFGHADLNCRNDLGWDGFRRERPLQAQLGYSLMRSTTFDDTGCKLGWITACLVVDIVTESLSNSTACTSLLRGIPMHHLIATDWPVIELLSHIWSTKWSNSKESLNKECDDQYHVSLSWPEFRGTIIEALNTGEREKLNRMLSLVNDVSWKAANEAIAPNGISIKDMTNRCSHGVAIAGVLRSWGILLSPNGDTQRIAELLLGHYGQIWINSAQIGLDSQWPIYPVMRLLKRIRYFSASEYPSPLRVAHSANVVLVLLRSDNSSMIERISDNYKRLGLWEALSFAPLSESAAKACLSVAGTTKCLPYLNSNPFVTKFTLLYHFLVLSPALLVSRVAVVFDSMWFFESPFRSYSLDLEICEELYSRFFKFNYMMFANTVAVRDFVTIVYRWINEYPFAVERGGLIYLLQHRDPIVNAPSYSYLPPIENVPVLRTRVVRWIAGVEGFYDPDFIGFDFNNVDDIDAVKENLDRYRLVIDNKGSRRFFFEAPSTVLIPFRARGNSSQCVESMYFDNIPEGYTGATNSTADPDFISSTFIKHISYASGCCEKDQVVCSRSAIEVGGANVSTGINGLFLDSKFKNRNREVIEFDRTNTMSGKTPSSTIGYYVWKPFVILKTLLDPQLAWNDVLVYTDAGMVFTESMRPLLVKYLNVSDVVATNTVMMEGHVTKRDVFVSLQTDDLSAVMTNQVASCFIAVRKTPRAIELFRWWLAASGCLDIIGEQENIYGLSNYDGFRFNNDDQTPFSVLLKKFGYVSISQKEMTGFLEASRNKAKFIAAINSFALKGRVSTTEEYMEAAENKVNSIIQNKTV